MKLEKYRNFLHHTDWNYLYSDDTWRWRANQKNSEFLREISLTSARHRCLYSGYSHKNLLINTKYKFKD